MKRARMARLSCISLSRRTVRTDRNGFTGLTFLRGFPKERSGCDRYGSGRKSDLLGLPSGERDLCPLPATSSI
jgi:hypothetical protein